MKKVLVLFSLFVALYGQKAEVTLSIGETKLESTFTLQPSSDKSYFLRGGLLYDDDASMTQLSAGVGTKHLIHEYSRDKVYLSLHLDYLFADSYNDKTISMLPVGVSVINQRMWDENKSWFIKANVAYATKVLSFADYDKYLSYGVESGVTFAHVTRFFVGYKHTEISDDWVLQNNFYVGFGYIF